MNRTEQSSTNRRTRRLIFAAVVLLCLCSPVCVRAAELTGLIEEESEPDWIADEVIPEDGLTWDSGSGREIKPGTVTDSIVSEDEAEAEPGRESDTGSGNEPGTEAMETEFRKETSPDSSARSSIRISPGIIIRRICEYCRGLDGRWEDQEDTTLLIQVNLTTNTVTVFRGKVPVKAFACSVGLREGSTPVGNFQLKDKLRWHELVGPSWGQWCSHITGDILFHTLPYYSNSDKFTMVPEEYNQIGTSSSHGCIRLAAADAKYLYDNCPVGTAVTVFSGTSEDDPLGRPMPLFVGNWTGVYDPTDITIAQEGRTSDWMWEIWSRPMKEFFNLK